MKPLVSIIIPTYNRSELLRETLNSVTWQSYENWECIIVDDGSTDETHKILQEFCNQDKRFFWFKRPDNMKSGGNGARNFGFQVSKGDWIQWFDDDDIMLQDYLKDRILKAQAKHNLLICNSYKTNYKLERLSTTNVHVEENILLQYAQAKLNVVTHSCLWKKQYLVQFKLFDENIRLGQEAELFQRLFSKLEESSYIIVDRALVLYRQHSDSKTGERVYYNINRTTAMFDVFQKGILLAKEINNSRVANAYYSRSISLWFTAFKNADIQNYIAIESMLVSMFNKENRFKMFLVGINFKLMKGINRTTLKQRKFLKRLELII